MFQHGTIPDPDIEDPDPIEVKGGYQSDNPPVPTQVNMMRVICHPDKMEVVKPQVAECVAGYAAYAQSLPTTKPGGTISMFQTFWSWVYGSIV